MPADHPHVLILCSDQHAGQIMGHMGDPLVRTPNMDRLAARGVTFENAYCPNPICVPGRYGIMTGNMIRDIGSLHYGDGLDPKTWTYPKHFARAGYQTTCVGKMHFMGLEQMHGWMFRPYGDMEYVDGHAKIPGFAGDPYADTKPRGVPLEEWVDRAGPGNDGFIIFDESVTREARIHLKDYWQGNIMPLYSSDRPLLYQVSWKTPHWPYWAPPELFEYYQGRVHPPAAPRPEPKEMHPYRRWMVEKFQHTDEQIARARAAYWGLIEYTDQQIGKVLDMLEELGVLDEFIIVYHADHGEMAGNHGCWGKGIPYEHSTRVPLMISWPGQIPEGKRIDTPVSTYDLFGTLNDYAGLDQPPGQRGQSLRPLIDEADGAEQLRSRTVFSEFYNHGSNAPAWVMARRGAIKYNRYGDGMPEQLFDLAADPHEQDNRADDPAYAQVKAELAREIDTLPQPWKWDESAEYLTPDRLLK